MRLKTSKKVFEALIEMATRSSEEIVLIGIGSTKGSDIIISELFKCKNVAENTRIEFKADPLCIYTAYKYAEKNGLEIVAVIHSHPTPPYPSNLDMKSMRLWNIPWIIIDSSTGASKAWIVNNNVVEIPIELIDDDCGRN
ncbi:MAG: M67 family metallopeptidase [Ignisphaera sp.]